MSLVWLDWLVGSLCEATTTMKVVIMIALSLNPFKFFFSFFLNADKMLQNNNKKKCSDDKRINESVNVKEFRLSCNLMLIASGKCHHNNNIIECQNI